MRLLILDVAFLLTSMLSTVEWSSALGIAVETAREP